MDRDDRRARIGGSFANTPPDDLAASARFVGTASSEFGGSNFIGFRVARLPEPSAVGLLLASGLALAAARRDRR